ncbi:cold-shock protein [Escherichia albertii]|uniref:cold shock domain-containing protein n=1 Tax=Escherichia albertii TaxID=208962 RepID=UPI000C9F2339|nr:cold shock domain-containing protein [Escherichia albertii]AUS68105.1 cold-shock protein [Escherichia albertii]EAB1453764.1 cold shock domain-containing protein [Escherichia albertii]EEW7343172.1 cold shock domain-containing protein [Escherichia albertii]EJY9800244.1 cold shock domain-containing protein [Escherichia albertii]MCU7326329.1 cold shock domain-containing protein [Escherichia albertii]
MDGVIKWFSEEKGYGFITDKNNKDYYFHVSDIKGALLPERGNNVHFEIETSPKGERARKIIVANNHENISSEERLDFCRNCNKKIYPRMITYQGTPQKTICPYCAGTIKKFEQDGSIFDLFIGLFILISSPIVIMFEAGTWFFKLLIGKKK